IRLRMSGKTYRYIQSELGVSSGVVGDVVRRAGLTKKIYDKVCKHCDKHFKSGNDMANFCDTRCRSKHNKMRYYRNPNNKTEHQKVCQSCGNTFISKVRRYTCCSSSCSMTLANSNRENKRRIWAKELPFDRGITLARLYKRDKGTCHICHGKDNLELSNLDNYYGSIDHLKPLSKNGSHTWGNVKLAHRICNIRKADNYVTKSPGSEELIE